MALEDHVRVLKLSPICQLPPAKWLWMWETDSEEEVDYVSIAKSSIWSDTGDERQTGLSKGVVNPSTTGPTEGPIVVVLPVQLDPIS